MAKPKREILTSPKGVAVWPRLNEPDTKYKPEGEFTTSLAHDPNDPKVQEQIKFLEKRRDELFEAWLSENPKKRKKAEVAPVFTEELDEDGDETGRILFKYKMRHKVKSKKTGKTYTLVPNFFDASKKAITSPPQVGSGSTLRISYELSGNFVESASKFYLSLRLVAVQIIDLVEFGTRTADSFGFDEEEGFEAEDEHLQARKSGDDDGDDADSAEGDDDSDGDDGDY